ncbi:MAG: CotH kinase family protein [Flavobacteriales bacterium]
MRLFFILLLSKVSFCQVIINEYSPLKGASDGEGFESDWIELYNNSNTTVNLSDYFLSDDENDLTKWSIPSIDLQAYSSIVFYCSSKNVTVTIANQDYYHTNFKLSLLEQVVLSNGQAIVDSSHISSLFYYGVSKGRGVDGGPTWCYFDQMTPNQSNNNSICYDGITPEPSISLESGWYQGQQFVSCSNLLPNTASFYSLNGSIPSFFSSPFSQILTIDSTTVLSVRSFTPNYLPSRVVDRTFIFNQDNYGMAVFSVHTNPENLWDYDNGIYVFGPNAQEDYPFFGANFWQPWSKFSRIEFFEKDKSKIAYEHIDLEIHGGWSRAEPQKSFRIDFKSKYTGRIEHPIFRDKPFLESFNNLNLRNGGQHTYSDKVQDAIFSRVAKETNVNFMAYEPCHLFLNGMYWGIYGIREKIDQHYVADNFNLESDSIDLLNASGPLNGSADLIYEIFEELTNADPFAQNYYDNFSQNFDVENYIDYFVIETYIQNKDWNGIAWGANNIKLWRPQTQDGKISYVLYDTDAAFGHFGGDVWENYLESAMFPGYPNMHSNLFSVVIQNPEFRCQFVNRYSDLLNTSFSNENFSQIVDVIKQDLIASIPSHVEVWAENSPPFGYITSVESWENDVNSIVEYNQERLFAAMLQLDYTLGLDEIEQVSIDVIPPLSGDILLNTIYPDSFPWSGDYFNGCDIDLSAIADSGFVFSHWTDENDEIISDQSTISYNLSENALYNAHFLDCQDILVADIFTNDTIVWFEINSNYDYNYQWSFNGLPINEDSVITNPEDGMYQLEISYENCKYNPQAIIFQSPIPVSNTDYSKNIKIYPNPTNGIFTIESNGLVDERAKIEVYDLLGKKVYFKLMDKFNSSLTIHNVDLSVFPDGLYIIKFSTTNFTHYSKITKQQRNSTF